MKNLLIRTLTGIVYVAALVGCVVWSPVSQFIFFALVTMATLLEFSTLVNRHAGASIVPHMNALAGFLLVAAVWLSCVGSMHSAVQMFALYGLMLLYLLIGELYRKAENPFKNWAFVFASQVYIALPFALMPLLSVTMKDETPVYDWIYPLSLFIFIWVNDSGAYLCGSALHNVFPAKLFPRISPKKSWVGSIGGGLLTLGAATVIWSLNPAGLSLVQWLVFALVVVVFGTWGDLVESLLKRQFQIKDSGKVLPGHGGMLDRFDSSLLAIPAAVIYLSWIFAL